MSDAQERADAARWRAIRAGATVTTHLVLGRLRFTHVFLEPEDLSDETVDMLEGEGLTEQREVDALMDKAFGLTPAAPPALPEGWTYNDYGAAGESIVALLSGPDNCQVSLWANGTITVSPLPGVSLTDLAQIVAYLQARQKKTP